VAIRAAAQEALAEHVEELGGAAFDLIVILVLLFGGIGLVLRSLRDLSPR
jgi:hypothetical protein